MYHATSCGATPPLAQAVEQRDPECSVKFGPGQGGGETLSPDLDGAQFAVTFWKDRHGLAKTESDATLRALMARIVTTVAPAKDKLPLFKLARFGDQRTDKGSLRHDRNMVAITGVEADYDGERVPFDRAVEIARKAGLRSLSSNS